MSEFQTKLHSVPSGGFLTDRDKDKKPILDVRELFGTTWHVLARFDAVRVRNGAILHEGARYDTTTRRSIDE